jgi:hypothetical protein
MASANAGATTAGTNEFVTLTNHALTLTGAKIEQHVKSSDGPGLLSPLEVVKDGKDRIGAILALQDRAVLAWTVGTFRMKNFETVIPYSSIESIEIGSRPGGAISKERETLRIKADGQTWDLVFANVFDGGRSIVPVIKGILEGSIRPVFESP